MAIFAISDLHLAFGKNKPMNIFGDNWENHHQKIEKDWKEKATDNDLILLPGDFSWATYLKDNEQEFKFLDNLPGKKILLKGNHDYWWATLKSMRKFLEEKNIKTIDFLHNNSYFYEDYIIVGTRGWVTPENVEDEKIIKREELRLKLSIEQGIKAYGKDKKIIVNMHFPPFENDNFINIMKNYNVKICIYGHLHGSSNQGIKDTNIDGINFKLVSCDYTNFKLVKII